jgi:3-methyladenine DNA glycosylase AlkD
MNTLYLYAIGFYKIQNMTSAELINDIVGYCKANASEANVVKYSHYFKGPYDAHGLSQPQLQSKVKELLKGGELTLEVAVEAAQTLLRGPKYEEITFGLLLVNGFGKQFSLPLLHEMEQWYTFSIHNWAHADTMGMMILPQFLKRNIVDYTYFKPWLASQHKFQRRCVPVTFIKILKTTDDYNPLFSFLEVLMTDPEREVHQGMGWFLREAWKKRRTDTEAFLLQWKDRSPRLIIQYATEKMTIDEKQRFKRVKG